MFYCQQIMGGTVLKVTRVKRSGNFKENKYETFTGFFQQIDRFSSTY